MSFNFDVHFSHSSTLRVICVFQHATNLTSWLSQNLPKHFIRSQLFHHGSIGNYMETLPVSQPCSQSFVAHRKFSNYLCIIWMIPLLTEYNNLRVISSHLCIIKHKVLFLVLTLTLYIISPLLAIPTRNIASQNPLIIHISDLCQTSADVSTDIKIYIYIRYPVFMILSFNDSFMYFCLHHSIVSIRRVWRFFLNLLDCFISVFLFKS